MGEKCPKCHEELEDVGSGYHCSGLNGCWYYKEKEEKINFSNYQPLVLGFWIPEPERPRMMMMAQVFKDDLRRRWKGFRIHFYADEYQPIGSKPLNWLHIHFIGQEGEVELYLLGGDTEYRIVPQWGYVPKHIQTLMRKFVRNNYQDIMEKIRQDFRNLGVEPKI